MSRSSEFAPREIVWAKVQSYPWWPGKIVKNLDQNNRTVYKVSFYGDATYSFLHAHQIVPFADFDAQLNSSFPFDFKLQKAVQMANTAFNRSKSTDQTTDGIERTISDQKQNMIGGCQKIEQQESKFNECELKTPLFQIQQTNNESHALDLLNIQVTQENVISLLEMHSNSSQQSSYCYARRKDSIQFQSKLKHELLKKYNLLGFNQKEAQSHRHQISNGRKAFNIEHQSTTQNKNIHKKTKGIHKISRLHRKHYGSKKHEIDILRTKCIKKLFSILKQSESNRTDLKGLSLKLMDKIFCIADNNLLKVKSLFLYACKLLNRSQQTIDQLLCQLFAQLEKLENEKKEDEEGSKITQIAVN